MSVFETVSDPKTWPAPKFPQAKEVAHGIRLNKTIEEIAGNWWSHRWFKILDEFNLGYRWERAKIYANRGQVLSIEIENGLVRAFVQGSDDQPYRVMVAVKTIAKAVWRSICQNLGKSSSFAIGLASGTFPGEQEISSVFENNGALLFPDRQGELHTKCTCLDWSNPCKHIAAVYLLLGAEFDRDPFLLFKLRGLEQSEFFALATPDNGLTVAQLVPPTTSSKAYQLSGLSDNTVNQPDCVQAAISFDLESTPDRQATHKERLRHFWRGSTDPAKLSSRWSLPTPVAAVPASLGEFPFWQGNESFLDCIRHAYETA